MTNGKEIAPGYFKVTRSKKEKREQYQIDDEITKTISKFAKNMIVTGFKSTTPAKKRVKDEEAKAKE